MAQGEDRRAKGRRKEDLDAEHLRTALTEAELEVVKELPVRVEELARQVEALTSLIEGGVVDQVQQFAGQAVREATRTREAVEDAIINPEPTAELFAERVRSVMTATTQPTTEGTRHMGDKPTEDEIRNEERQTKARASGAAHAAADGAREAGNSVWALAKKYVIPTSRDEVAKMAVSYAVGFFTGGRVARSDWMDAQLNAAE